MQHSLLYVSKSMLPPATANEVARQIASESVNANRSKGITGALIFTGSHFAQIIEGERLAVDELIAAIQQDARHTELKIAERMDIEQRRFSDWSMAYMGPSQFVSRQVLQLLDQSNAERTYRAAKWMSDLMAEFSNSI